MRCSKELVVVDTKIFAYRYMLESVLGHTVTHSFSALKYYLCTSGVQNACEKEGFD